MNIGPYIVLVDVGKSTEINRPRNCEKLPVDSQLILMRFLNRCQPGNKSTRTSLLVGLYRQIQNAIGIDPATYEFLLRVDANTAVSVNLVILLLNPWS